MGIAIGILGSIRQLRRLPTPFSLSFIPRRKLKLKKKYGPHQRQRRPEIMVDRSSNAPTSEASTEMEIDAQMFNQGTSSGSSDALSSRVDQVVHKDKDSPLTAAPQDTTHCADGGGGGQSKDDAGFARGRHFRVNTRADYTPRNLRRVRDGKRDAQQREDTRKGETEMRIAANMRQGGTHQSSLPRSRPPRLDTSSPSSRSHESPSRRMERPAPTRNRDGIPVATVSLRTRSPPSSTTPRGLIPRLPISHLLRNRQPLPPLPANPPALARKDRR